MCPCRVLIADDHQMFCDALRVLLKDVPGIEVIGNVSNGLELLSFLENSVPDMIILDISMPKLRGIEAAQVIKKLYPQVKILILTMHRDKAVLSHALAAGADGYLVKNGTSTELIAAIEAVRMGKCFVSTLVAGDMVELVRERNASTLRGTSYYRPTKREREVLQLIAEGRSNREIADLLCVSVRTVEHHRDNLKKKLRLKTTADLIKYAIREGYTSSVT